jgi:hypothetical protein
MKNIIKLFGIIALVTVIGFSMAGCKNDDDDSGAYGKTDSSLNGTWKGADNSEGTLTIDGDSWKGEPTSSQAGNIARHILQLSEYSLSSDNSLEISGGKIIMKSKHVPDQEYYTYTIVGKTLTISLGKDNGASNVQDPITFIGTKD